MSNRFFIRAAVSVSFVRSELGNWQEYYTANRRSVDQWGPDDGVVFISCSRDQVVFVKGVRLAQAQPFVASHRIRCLVGTFQAELLPYYARHAGLVLDNQEELIRAIHEARDRVLQHRRELQQVQHTTQRPARSRPQHVRQERVRMAARAKTTARRGRRARTA